MPSMVTIVTVIVSMQIFSQSLCVLCITIVRRMKLETSIVGAFNGKTFVTNFVRISQ